MLFQFFKRAILVILYLFLSASNLQAADPVSEVVSISSEGILGNDDSGAGSISAYGRYIAFSSNATNLVQGDTNNRRGIFVHDRQTGQTTRVSVNSSGSQGNGDSSGPSISSTGQLVAFTSKANNLVQDDTNNKRDVFVHDRQTGQTVRVSVNSSGSQGNEISLRPSISSTGQFVAFTSYSNNLVQDDTNNTEDVFVHDRQTGQTTRVSISSNGEQGNGSSVSCSISSDGRLVAFSSDATNLVQDDTNTSVDVFVHDRQTGQTTRVSISSNGEQGNGSSSRASISAFGRYVVFVSSATNMVDDDTNGLDDIFIHDLQTGTTERASVNNNGEQAEGSSGSFDPYVSGHGRYVAFQSIAANLAENDYDQKPDMFIKDRETGTVTKISFGNSSSWDNQWLSGISLDGSYLLFASDASDLVIDDTNNLIDVFVRGPFLSPQPPPPQLESFPIPGVLKQLLLSND